ncbi:hypothetical protein DES38_10657 [Streptohalobacillus salinus]|uniref:Uncharacterized protein n=1 Tax=Streptohalobacillus salinus TaxID=621096 RepID=A0A2V3W9I7_9BACI|nr:hypothetical protein [Streptohalobacillus salinus]PXW91023.1 hypothetical protein DES38_10657 [Streptohalobacillus salinus]
MKNNQKKLIIYLVSGSLILMIGFGFSLWHNVNQDYQQLQIEVAALQQQIRDLEYQLPAELDKAIAESDSNVSVFDYQYVEMDRATRMVTTNLFITLKEAREDAHYNLVLTDANEQEKSEYGLEHIEGMTYRVSLPLFKNFNYTLTVYEETFDGVQTMMTAGEIELPIHDQLTQDRVYVSQSHSGLEDGEFSAGFLMMVEDFGVANFGVESVSLEVWHEGKQVVEETITNQLEEEYSPELLEAYNMALASGEIDSDLSLERYIKEEDIDLSSYASDESGYYYEDRFHVSELDGVDFADIEVLINVTTKDGEKETHRY